MQRYECRRALFRKLTRCQTFDNWQAFAIHILTLTFRAHFEIKGIIVQGGPGMPKWEGGTGPLTMLLYVVVAGNALKMHNACHS